MSTVLIVDDDPLISTSLARDLKRRGWNVLTATRVSDALELLSKYSVDVVLTELVVSGESGLELLAKLKSFAPSVRTVLMSAYGDSRDRLDALRLGAAWTLVKPFTLVELIHAIDQALGSCERSTTPRSLVEELMFLHRERATLALRIGHTGAIQLREGEIVHAEHGSTTGETALCSILRERAETFTRDSAESEATTIHKPFLQAILDALSLVEKDELGSQATEGP